MISLIMKRCPLWTNRRASYFLTKTNGISIGNTLRADVGKQKGNATGHTTTNWNTKTKTEHITSRNEYTTSQRQYPSASRIPKPGTQFKQYGVSWESTLITGILGGVLLIYMYYLRWKKDERVFREREQHMGEVAINIKFELMNAKGELVTSEQFRGQWLLLYFGFTHCPDICPDELEKLVHVVDELEKENGYKVQPIFISIDPDRDTPEIAEKYVKEFSDKIIGLSGTKEQIQQVSKDFRIYYSNGPKDVDQDYIVDHTIIVYLVTPEGKFSDYYTSLNTAPQMTKSILANISKYENFNNPGIFDFLSLKRNEK